MVGWAQKAVQHSSTALRTMVQLLFSCTHINILHNARFNVLLSVTACLYACVLVCMHARSKIVYPVPLHWHYFSTLKISSVYTLFSYETTDRSQMQADVDGLALTTRQCRATHILHKHLIVVAARHHSGSRHESSSRPAQPRQGDSLEMPWPLHP